VKADHGIEDHACFYAYAPLDERTIGNNWWHVGCSFQKGSWATKTLEVAMPPEPTRANDEVLRRVQGEFLEMPGLRLTEPQARRLWGLDAASCDALLGALVEAKFLFRTRDGAFMRVEYATPAKASLRSRRLAGAA
jgi:hypothetical protein